MFRLLLILFTCFLLCCSSPANQKQFNIFNNKKKFNGVNSQEISVFYNWASSYSAQNPIAGYRIHITSVDSEDDWQKINEENTKSCPNADFNFYFAKAFYKSWENKIEIKYCFREGDPKSGRFQIYYLPVVEYITNTRFDNISIYLTKSNSVEFDTPDQRAKELSRFLIIKDDKNIHLVNLSDIHPYLAETTRDYILLKSGGNNLLRENQLYWRNIKPVVINGSSCETDTSEDNPLLYRDRILHASTELTPRSSCIKNDDNSLIGFAPNNRTSNAGFLLIRYDNALTVYPLLYSGYYKTPYKIEVIHPSK